MPSISDHHARDRTRSSSPPLARGSDAGPLYPHSTSGGQWDNRDTHGPGYPLNSVHQQQDITIPNYDQSSSSSVRNNGLSTSHHQYRSNAALPNNHDSSSTTTTNASSHNNINGHYMNTSSSPSPLDESLLASSPTYTDECDLYPQRMREVLNQTLPNVYQDPILDAYRRSHYLSSQSQRHSSGDQERPDLSLYPGLQRAMQRMAH